MDRNDDFIVEDGVLTGYRGPGERVAVPDGVTRVRRSAFQRNQSITEIRLPDSVLSVEDGAFMCPYLETIWMGDGVEDIRSPFLNALGLRRVFLGRRVKCIGERSFIWLRRLEYIGVSPENPAYASLDGVLFSKDMRRLIAYPSGKTDAAYVIPDGVEEICPGAFCICRELKTVTFPVSLKHIGVTNYRAFSDETRFIFPGTVSEFDRVKIGSLTRPASVACADGMWTVMAAGRSRTGMAWKLFGDGTMIVSGNGDMDISWHDIEEGIRDRVVRVIVEEGVTGVSFIALRHLEKIELPEGVRSIGHVFGCGSLKRLDLPQSVACIHDQAFEYCESLEEIVVPDHIEKIGMFAFANCTFLRRVSLPDSLREIGTCAFSGCTALEEAEFRARGGGLREIPYGCFKNCRKLRRAALPASVRVIEKGAFAGCETLAEVTLPPVLEEIGIGAFYRCASLTSVDLKRVNKIGDYAFWGCGSLREAQVPEGAALGREVFSGSPSEGGECMPEATKAAGVRRIIPRHLDYWEGVYGIGAPPCYLEFALYENRAAEAVVDSFFHFDVGNLTAALNWEEWDDEEKKRAFLRQAERLEAGEIDYWISWLYYPAGYPASDSYLCYESCLTRGNTIFDIKNARGVSPYYAVIFVRETRPLMPEVLSGWMEKLSPVLFGDHCSYHIPKEEYPDPGQVRKDHI